MRPMRRRATSTPFMRWDLVGHRQGVAGQTDDALDRVPGDAVVAVAEDHDVAPGPRAMASGAVLHHVCQSCGQPPWLAVGLNGNSNFTRVVVCADENGVAIEGFGAGKAVVRLVRQ
jgi:hypothetical protein